MSDTIALAEEGLSTCTNLVQFYPKGFLLGNLAESGVMPEKYQVRQNLKVDVILLILDILLSLNIPYSEKWNTRDYKS